MDDRPDLSGVPAPVVAYIETLEAELEQLRGSRTGSVDESWSEAPTTLHVITISAGGDAKRTPRHLYSRQRRGGMGVFDLETGNTDTPSVLVVADESATLLMLTERGRVFRLPVTALPQTEVRARGRPVQELLDLQAGERVVAAIPASESGSLVVASERGWVRRYRASFLGRSMFQGTSVHDPAQGGPLVAACWADEGADLFIATVKGLAIRFPGHHVRDRRGTLGLRVDQNDLVVAVAPAPDESSVFLLGADGKGTLRLMNGFRANKAPGAAGKQALKTDYLVGAVAAGEEDDLFVISGLGKIIRFAAAEVPPKEGVVQGVNCMSLRADEVVAVAVSPQSPVS